MRRLVRAGLVLLLLVSTTSVAQWGEAQYCEVQVYPASYAFATAEVQREPETSCSIVGTNYTVCAGPSRLTDSELGPQDNTTFDSSYYYTWQGRRSSDRFYILFTFSQTESITNITLHYYVHNLGDTQPVVIVFGVDDDFEIQSPNVTGRYHHNILLQSTSIGTNSASIFRHLSQPPVNISTTRIVLLIRGRWDMFSLSEVKFFANISNSTPCPNPPATTTATSTVYSSTTPADSAATTTAEASLTVAAPVPTGSDFTATTSTEPPMTTDTASPPVAAIAAGLFTGLAAITALTVAAVLGAIVYRKCGGKRAGKGVEFAMDENQCYASTTRVTQAPPRSSDGRVYDEIITSTQEGNIYEPIPA